MKRMFALVLVLCLLCSCAALAEIRRGDRGDDVRQLQQLLIDTGWLFETADGIFGKNTEQALKKYQTSKGVQSTGVADDALIAMLTADLEALDAELTPEFYTDGAGADGRGVEGYCYQETNTEPRHESVTVYCPAHSSLIEQANRLLQRDDYTAAMKLYSDEIARLYNQMAEQEGFTPQKSSIQGALNAFNQAVNLHGTLASEFYGPYASAAPMREQLKLMQMQLAFLCEIVNMEAAGEGK